MSKSFRKRPIVGNSGDTDKWDKRKSNRKFRQKLRQKLRDTTEAILPQKVKEVSDERDFNKDGKQYFDKTSDLYEQLIRK